MPDQWGRTYRSTVPPVANEDLALPCRQLMKDGEWLVPPDQRPKKMAPPPGAEERDAYQQARTMEWMDGKR